MSRSSCRESSPMPIWAKASSNCSIIARSCCRLAARSMRRSNHGRWYISAPCSRPERLPISRNWSSSKPRPSSICWSRALRASPMPAIERMACSSNWRSSCDRFSGMFCRGGWLDAKNSGKKYSNRFWSLASLTSVLFIVDLNERGFSTPMMLTPFSASWLSAREIRTPAARNARIKSTIRLSITIILMYWHCLNHNGFAGIRQPGRFIAYSATLAANVLLAGR